MLYLVHRVESIGNNFNSPLSDAGVIDSHALIDVLKHDKVVMIYVGPSIREIETIKPYKLKSVAESSVVRMNVVYDIYTHVDSKEKLPQPLSLEYLLKSGFNRQSVYGTLPHVESFGDFQTRVLQWFTNVCLEQYKESPVPTAVVADADVIAVIMYYMLAREPVEKVENAIESMCHYGSVLRFTGNGFGFDFLQIK
jgi:broad specificity phosphatase PhoE